LDGGKNWEKTEFYDMNSIQYSGRYMLDDIFFAGKHGWILFNNSMVFKTIDYGGLSQYVSVTPESRRRQNLSSIFKMRISSAKGGMSNIIYTLNAESALSVSVYNLKGKRIAFQPKRLLTAGEHSFSFKAPKGFYIVEAKAQGKHGEGERRFSERILVR
jgi:hypothetical protein